GPVGWARAGCRGLEGRAQNRSPQMTIRMCRMRRRTRGHAILRLVMRLGPLRSGLVLVPGRQLWDYPGAVRNPMTAESTAAGSLARVRAAGAHIGDAAPCIY